MELQEIEVIIDKDGQVSLTVRGVKGTACLDITQSLEAALGGVVETRQMTAEAYEPAAEAVVRRQQLRKAK